jgi:hypothetical protein
VRGDESEKPTNRRPGHEERHAGRDEQPDHVAGQSVLDLSVELAPLGLVEATAGKRLSPNRDVEPVGRESLQPFRARFAR